MCRFRFFMTHLYKWASSESCIAHFCLCCHVLHIFAVGCGLQQPYERKKRHTHFILYSFNDNDFDRSWYARRARAFARTRAYLCFSCIYMFVFVSYHHFIITLNLYVYVIQIQKDTKLYRNHQLCAIDLFISSLMLKKMKVTTILYIMSWI